MSYCFDKGIPHSTFLNWSAEDRSKVLAYSMEASSRCTMCGTAGWEWEENKFAYTAIDDFCKGCYQKAMYSETQQKPLPGTNVKLVPTTPEFKAQQVVAHLKRQRLMNEE